MNRVTAFAAVVLLLVPSSAWGNVLYTITDLGTLGGASSCANDINNSAQVVGWADASDGARHAFRTAANQPINPATDDLGTLNGPESRASGINNSGQVVGWDGSDGKWHAFVYSGGGPMQDLGSLGGTVSDARGINDSGQVVGRAFTSGGPAHAFRTAPNQPINPATDDLGTLAGESAAWGINNIGQVVGNAYARGSGFHAFLYTGSGPMQDLGTLGGEASAATAINNRGQVVGWTHTVGDVGYHAFLYSDSGPTQDLNDLIPPDSGWKLGYANGINDLGQIVGQGAIGGQSHAFRLDPVPEPSALALFAAGAPCVFAFACRRRRRAASARATPPSCM